MSLSRRIFSCCSIRSPIAYLRTDFQCGVIGKGLSVWQASSGCDYGQLCSVSSYSKRQRNYLWIKSFRRLLLPQGSRFCTAVVSNTSRETGERYEKIYKFKYIRYARVISRFKFYQTVLSGIVCIPLWHGYTTGMMPVSMLIVGGTTVVATGVMMLIYSYLAMQILGELQVERKAGLVKISRLDFMGKRRDMIIPVENVLSLEVDPAKLPGTNDSLYCKMEFIDENDRTRKIYYSLRWGTVLDSTLFALIGGNRSKRN